jgi:hypothetical protein
LLKLITYLHENGVRTERGKTFSNSSVHGVLKRYRQRVERIEKVREVKFEKEIVNFHIELLRDSILE